MQPYQERYIANCKEIAARSDLFALNADTFPEWLEESCQAEERMQELREENMRLLHDEFFPVLDTLPSLSSEEIEELDAFGDILMDWKTNLDCGLYITIHEALLSLARIRKDRSAIIRELYKLGMGLYYQDRMIQGLESEHTQPYYFRNEMVFTEAGSYLRFFEEIEDEATKGYIIRALANIAICTVDRHRRVAVSARTLQITQDEYYRKQAPGLPWDTYLQRAHQQMSSNRNTLSRGDMTPSELALILESCQVVFQPEKDNKDPNLRWLWPYYEMEYTCGFTDLKTTLQRMEDLIVSAPADRYDYSGLYATVQLPIYYGRLLKANQNMPDRARYISFLKKAYQRMTKVLFAIPAENFDDLFAYFVTLVFSDYYETEGVPTYREITSALIPKLNTELYIRSYVVGELAACLSERVYDRDPSFFAELPPLQDIPAEKKKETLSAYARNCGLYHDFGLIKLKIESVERQRDLFQTESDIYRLHTFSGHDDLCSRASTKDYADIALGHHRWYSEGDGYPEGYRRNESPWRAMTDCIALSVFLQEEYQGDLKPLLEEIDRDKGRFSPLLTSYLSDRKFCEELETILTHAAEEAYIHIWNIKNEKAS